MDAAERKARLREVIAASRRGVPRIAAERAAIAVARRVEALPAFAQARAVALYAARPDELPTGPIFDTVLRHGKAALLPRLDGARPVFAPVDAWEELVPGRYGVLEPPPGRPPARPDLVLVPGVAYDLRGRRLGRGAGWYDRALAELERGVTLVGVGYEFQIVAEVPQEAWDRPVDAIVTESALHWARSESES